MFSFLDKKGVCGIRLPEKEREDFLKKYKTKLFETQGTILKEYVTVPDDLLKKTKELKKWFEISYAYVKTLKPKATKKKKQIAESFNSSYIYTPKIKNHGNRKCLSYLQW